MASATGKILFDQTGERLYETGVSNCALYVFNSTEDSVTAPGITSGTTNYGGGVAWNGITGITESPSGAESTPLYADNIKYLNLVSAEEFGATIEAYMYPDKFEECDGSATLTTGVTIGQQNRKTFCLAYKTVEGNDEEGNSYNEKLHIIYGATAAPSEKGYQTINDSPEAITFSWEVTTTPVPVEGAKPTASLTISKNGVDDEAWEALEAVLYGTSTTTPWCPTPDQVKAIVDAAA